MDPSTGFSPLTMLGTLGDVVMSWVTLALDLIMWDSVGVELRICHTGMVLESGYCIRMYLCIR